MVNRTYMTFFDRSDSSLTARDYTIIREFRSSLSLYDRQRIDLLASIDTSETNIRDRGLARRRGEAVAIALREDGLPDDTTVNILPLGRERLLVPTPDNTPEPQNRNVILVFRGGRQFRPTRRQAECREWLVTHRCGMDAGAEQAALCAQVRRVADEFKAEP